MTAPSHTPSRPLTRPWHVAGIAVAAAVAAVLLKPLADLDRGIVGFAVFSGAVPELWSLGMIRPGAVFSGPMTASDGDSLRLGRVRIRLAGVDAPEMAQTCRSGATDYPCGEVARAVLAGIVRDRDVTCRVTDTDRFGRLVAVCLAGDEDIGRMLVASGTVVAEGVRYEVEEAAARSRGTGLWAGDFERPADWRRRQRGST